MTTTVRSIGSATGVEREALSGRRRGLLGLAAIALLAAAAPVTGASVEPIEKRIAVCFACHGTTGRSETPAVPSLGGQPAFFSLTQLFLFREGRRNNTQMIESAKGLSDNDLQAFSDRIAKLPPPAPPAEAADAARFRRGQALVNGNHCMVCHNPDFSGREQMPRLANQREDYLVKSLREFKSGARIGYGGAMASELSGLADADLLDLAHYLAYLPRPTKTAR